MSYSKASIDAVRKDFEIIRQKNQEKRLERLDTIYALSPEIKEIDVSLSNVSNEIMSAISLGKEKCLEEIEKIKKRNLALQEKRAILLENLGFEKNYTDLTYNCNLCKDTGYIGSSLCKCFKNAIVLKSYESSGLSKLLQTQSFDNFSFEFYSSSEQECIRENYNELYSFAKNFDIDKRSFLLFGATGLGKTHLSTAVAKYLLDNGYNVVYETAQNVFSDFEKDRFRDHFSSEEPVSSKYFECDLLILDDLGTEIVSQFSVSCLYNIINTRLNKGLPIIASTNLTAQEIRKIYHDRITSRLFGEFIIKQFVGKDIRRQKILK